MNYGMNDHKGSIFEIFEKGYNFGPAAALNVDAADMTELQKLIALAIPGILLGAVLPALLFPSVADYFLIFALLGSGMLFVGLRCVKQDHTLFCAGHVLATMLMVLNLIRFGCSLIFTAAMMRILFDILAAVAGVVTLAVILFLSLGVCYRLYDSLLMALLLPVLYGVLFCLSTLEYSPVLLGVKVVIGILIALLLFRMRRMTKEA